MKKLILLFVISSLILSCGKDDGAKAKTKTDLLCQASWKFSAATVGGADVSSFLQPCQKDNIVKFNTIGDGSLDEGASKCNSGDPQTTTMSWSFQSNETQLQISTILFTGGSNLFNVVTLTESQLVVSQNITVGGTAQNAVVTFVH